MKYRFAMCVFTASLLLVGCTGSSSQTPTTSSAPGSASPQLFVGTFPLTYSGTTGSCLDAFLPMTMTISSASFGTDNSGAAIILLSGELNASGGGGNLFGNILDKGVNGDAPSAFITSGAVKGLVINLSQGQAVTTIYSVFIATGAWQPPATAQGDFWINDGGCRMHSTVTIGPPAA